jgi:hypothetical protein
MPLAEDLSVFFVDFGVELVWEPANGNPTVSELVIFDEETIEVLGGAQSSDEPSFVFRTAGGLAELASRELVTIDAVAYEVREVRKIDDGKFSIATLTEL